MNIALGKFEVPAVCIRRSDLLSILLAALPQKCLRLGYEFERLEQDNAKVRIYFKDGRIEQHDAVVGADGIRSRVRSELFGISDPIYRGYTVWRGLARYEGAAITPGSIASLGEQGSVSESLTPATEDSPGTPRRMCLRIISTRIADEKVNFKSCSLVGMSQSQIFLRRLTKTKF